MASAATGVGAPVGVVVGGIMVVGGAALIYWENTFEAEKTIEDANKEYIDPLRKELEENEKALKQLEKGNNPKSDPCKEKRK